MRKIYSTETLNADVALRCIEDGVHDIICTTAIDVVRDIISQSKVNLITDVCEEDFAYMERFIRDNNGPKSKYIYSYDISVNGLHRDRYLIIYENKEYYYCKVNGSNNLRQFNKAHINENYGNNIYSIKPLNLDELHEIEKYGKYRQYRILKKELSYTKNKLNQQYQNLAALKADINKRYGQFEEECNNE